MAHAKRVFAALFLLIGACGPSPTEQTRANVKLAVLAGEYTRADTIDATVTNGLAVAVSYHIYQCPSFAIERRVNGGWHATDSSPPRPCGVEAILLMLRAGGTQSFTQPIRDWMPDGEYRLKVWVGPEGGGGVDLISNTFRIRTS